MSEIYLDIKVLTGLRVKYTSPDYKFLTIVATNPWTGNVYSKGVAENEEFHVNIHYPTPWHIDFIDKGNVLSSIDLNYEGANVGIWAATEALGDTLAWVPIIEAWMNKVKPARVHLYTKWNRLFDRAKYPSNITWVDENPQEYFQSQNLDLFHALGISSLHGEMLTTENNHATAVNWQDCNMIDTQNYTFGVELEERKPKLITLQEQRPFPEKYVTICPAASQKIKHWLNPKGWMMLVRACEQLGYKVVVIGNTPTYIPTVINGIGNDIHQAMYFIKHAEFHIGLSSGLAWMAWALNKPVLMIGDFTNFGYEFSSNLVRMFSDNEQSGVFNKVDIPWKAKWEHDPYNDNHQLARGLSIDHALKALEVLVSKIGKDFKGVYVLPNGDVKDIIKLRPKVVPLNYS